jgi:hypothetical protein
MRNQTSKQIKKMKEDINFTDVNWKILHHYLPEKLLEELDEEHDTNIHQRLSTASRRTSVDPLLVSIPKSPDRPSSDQISTNSIFQFDLDPMSINILESFIQSTNNSDSNNECHQTNMLNEIIKRFLTAMSVDYEKQWYLGMIRRRTLKILIETVGEAKTKLSLKRHWQLLVKRFCMPLWLKYLIKFDKIKWLNKLTQKLLFNHLILTIELTLGKTIFIFLFGIR